MNSPTQSSLPLISVIITTYNRRDYIIEAVESALNQTYPHLEVLIVDDGSTDNTRQLIRERYGDNPRVAYYYQENNKRAAAFNHGLRYAKGEFIATVDSDNRWLPHRLETGYDALVHNPDYDIVYGDNILINEQGQEISRQNMRRYSGKITAHLMRDNCVSINTALVPRRCYEQLGPMDSNCKRADDYELWLRLSTAYRFLYIPQFMAEYRVMDDQLSSDKRGRFAATEQILRNFQARFPEALSPAEFRQGWAFFYTRKARYYASVGGNAEAMKDIYRAMTYGPLCKATWRSLAAIVSGREKRRSAAL
ncbi:MAG: glycosyltransferase [Halomonadaceae bacterium]|nr:MAG: glycosyltransferase [Halomonadaceae bacterium]